MTEDTFGPDEETGSRSDSTPSQNDEQQISRRDFLKYSSATTLGLPLLSACATQGSTPDDPTPGPHFAFIGTGGRGAKNIQRFANFNVHCPCFCNVDKVPASVTSIKIGNERPVKDGRR